ncbi:hypothetical protein KQX54_018188, partial [Cotesia glomerata]
MNLKDFSFDHVTVKIEKEDQEDWKNEYPNNVYDQDFSQELPIDIEDVKIEEEPENKPPLEDTNKINNPATTEPNSDKLTPNKPHSCVTCSAKFRSRANMLVHMRTHTGEKPYSCNVCKSRFSQKSYLKIHMRIHTLEKPFTCDICSAKFSRKDVMAKHLRIHTGEKPYACK